MTRRLLATTASAAALALGLGASASAQTTLNAGGANSEQPIFDTAFTQYTNNDPSALFSYDGVGSGPGQTAFLTNNIGLFNMPTEQYGTIVGSTVHFAASDSFLTSTQISGYTLASTDGPLIQIPSVGVAETIPYNNSGQTKTLTLNDDQLCGIISGKLVNWNQISSSATPGQVIVVYRSDGSGATFLLTQHLSAVCTSSNSVFSSYPVLITKTFGQLFPNGVPPGSAYLGESGSANLVQGILNNPLSIGYVTPDYTSVAPGSPNTTSLPVASLVNGVNGIAYQPTVANITLGLKSAGAGSTNPTPPSTQSAAANPLNWVPSIPVTNAGYSIVGYSTFDLSQCYADATAGSILIGFLTDLLTKSSYFSIITTDGFVPLVNSAAAKYQTAVKNDFLTNKSHYNLSIDNSSVCASTSKKHTGFAGR